MVYRSQSVTSQDNMFVKLVVLASAVAYASAVWNGPLAGGVPAHQYPAGVSPQACPNFPNCANPAVAANPNAPAPNAWAQPQQAWNQGQNQWNQGNQWNPAPVPQWNGGGQNALDRGEYIGDGDYHGEGLREAGAYGRVDGPETWTNPQQNQWNQGGQWNPQPAQHGVPAQIPAGVDPGSCPNYPFCH